MDEQKESKARTDRVDVFFAERVNKLLREAKIKQEPLVWTCCGVTRPVEMRCSCGEGADD